MAFFQPYPSEMQPIRDQHMTIAVICPVPMPLVACIKPLVLDDDNNSHTMMMQQGVAPPVQEDPFRIEIVTDEEFYDII